MPQKKLLILGSSTSTGIFGPSNYDSSYVARLQRYYSDKGSPFILVNRAVAGDNCYHGMPADYTPPDGRNVPRPYYNITDGLLENPDVVLVNYPSNGYDIYNIPEVMFCLRTIRQTALRAGKTCFITTSQPRDYPGDDVRRKLAEIRDSVLKEFGPYAINFWDGIANDNNTILDIYNADGTHLNNAGHTVLFNRVVEKDIFNIPPPQLPGNGLRFSYFEGNWDFLPDFNSLTPVKTGTSANLDISVRSITQTDQFGFLWQGSIYIPSAGTYRFETVSDDGSKLFFNTSYTANAPPLINNDGVHAPYGVSATVDVPAAGFYPIAISFFEKYGGETMQLFWEGPGFSRQQVPNEAFSGTITTPGSGLNYKYYEGDFNSIPDFSILSPIKTGRSANIDLGVKPATVFDHFAFTWDGYIRVPAAGRYTFETVSDDGSKFYFNSGLSPVAQPLLNNDGVHAPWGVSASIDVPAAGLYPMALSFFEKDGGETMELYWSGPGIERQRIPDEAFSQGLPSVVPAALIASDKREVALSASFFPNPFKESVNVQFFNASANDKISIELYDFRGRLITNYVPGKQAMGNTVLKIDLTGRQLATGIYIAKLMINGKLTKTVKLVKAKG